MSGPGMPESHTSVHKNSIRFALLSLLILVTIASGFFLLEVERTRKALRQLAIKDNALVDEIIQASASENITIGEMIEKCGKNIESREEIMSDLRTRDDWLYKTQTVKYLEILGIENEYVRALLRENICLARVSAANETLEAADRPYHEVCTNRSATWSWAAEYDLAKKYHDAAQAEWDRAFEEWDESQWDRRIARGTWRELESKYRPSLSLFPPPKLPSTLDNSIPSPAHTKRPAAY